MKILYLLLSTTLLVLHGIFFLRPVILNKSAFRPKKIDKISKNLSLFLLLPTIIVGTITVKPIFWSVIIWMPIILIITSQFLRPTIIKHPYILPFLNLLCILMMFLLGLKEFLWH